MAEHENKNNNNNVEEVKDRGLFDDFLGKKDEEDKSQVASTHHEVVVVTQQFDKVEVSEPEKGEDENYPTLFQKLHPYDTTSSSSSEEEEGEEGEKNKEKGLKEKLKEKLGGEEDKEESKQHEHNHKAVAIPVEKVGDAANPYEDKGFLEKIIPGHNKAPIGLAACSGEAAIHPEETKEKKGFLEKMKEKLPGYHSKEGVKEEH